MSTAARPTFHSAQGRASFGGFRNSSHSAKDQLAHTKLKFRQLGQASKQEREVVAKKDIKSALEINEQLLLGNKGYIPSQKIHEQSVEIEKNPSSMKLLTNEEEEEIDLNEIKRKYDDEDVDYEQNSDDGFESSDDEKDGDNDNDEDDDDDDDDDDEEELQRELERIKAERAVAQERRDQEAREQEARLRHESALHGNALVQLDSTAGDTNAKIKRKWNDDVVFKNQSRDESSKRKEFINDTIRNDFHRSFLKKYIR